MTQREKYRKYVHFTPGSQCPNMDLGPRLETYERWLNEGLNPGLDPRQYDEWCDAFGLDRYPLCVTAELTREPLFKVEVLAETADTITKRIEDGSIIQEVKVTLKSIPHTIRQTIVSKEDWDRLKRWLALELPLPADAAAQETFKKARDARQPVWLLAGSMVGMVRTWLGFETFAMMGYDDPEWLEDMIEASCQLAERRIRLFGEHHVPLDGIHFWEDICYNSGPIIAPTHFRSMAVPRYKRVAALARSYGYDRISVDSDGNTWSLLEGWLDGGVNYFWPVEVQAGMDVNELQDSFHGRAVWAGNIHKSRLAEGEKSIVKELERIKPALGRGGYIPMADHNLVPEISFENYLTYLRLRHEVLGLGRGAPDRERVTGSHVSCSAEGTAFTNPV